MKSQKQSDSQRLYREIIFPFLCWGSWMSSLILLLSVVTVILLPLEQSLSLLSFVSVAGVAMVLLSAVAALVYTEIGWRLEGWLKMLFLSAAIPLFFAVALNLLIPLKVQEEFQQEQNQQSTPIITVQV